MTTRRGSNRLSLVLSATALIVAVGATGGPALASIVFANNSDKVDGKHAVGAKATVAQRAGKLVATTKAGYLPNNLIKKAPDANLLDGQDSSVYLDRYTKSQIDALPSTRLVAIGRITGFSGGLVSATGNVTAARLGTGAYQLSIPGLNVGCTAFPVVVATPFGGGHVTVTGLGTSCATGDSTISLSTTNTADAAADADVFFTVYSGLPTTAAPAVARKAAGAPSYCELTAAGTRTCR